uniref:Uncharacterized protein n=1 Tax=Chromera velia CCMP2878 TaxID=1169474 RepID=A0A0G4F323_9ALVE|eukprot:Cvel_14992.t1-p1 / transcript=Cvel_14992.t1 / gene=Cvel_14992 / organism=Chromera_velia_CCMP2878 / gene_product=hypothetical protein / transcript_product=hypothetical protein / location=Cvel_scaffold1090:40328-42656(+) / protein_length=296 / sequence_SO=supercontig / SO=protein_coding / is_pseudo=false
MFIELITNRTSLSGDILKFHQAPMPRVNVTEAVGVIHSSAPLSPVVVSRGTRRIQEVRKWYTEVLEAEVLFDGVREEEEEEEGGDGTQKKNVKVRALCLRLREGTPFKVQLWFFQREGAEEGQREEEEKKRSLNPSEAPLTVGSLENSILSLHANISQSTVCGFDQYSDFHFAYDQGGPRGMPGSFLDPFVERALNVDSPLPVQIWRMPRGPLVHSLSSLRSRPPGAYFIYMTDPTGWTVQLNGPLKEVTAFLPEGVGEEDVPSYKATCEDSVSGCKGEGLCSVKVEEETEKVQFY